jgi:predicted small lipoprotein YifL
MNTYIKSIAVICLIFSLANCGIKPKKLEPVDNTAQTEHPRSYPSSK